MHESVNTTATVLVLDETRRVLDVIGSDSDTEIGQTIDTGRWQLQWHASFNLTMHAAPSNIVNTVQCALPSKAQPSSTTQCLAHSCAQAHMHARKAELAQFVVHTKIIQSTT